MHKERSLTCFFKSKASLFIAIVIFVTVGLLLFFIDQRYRVKNIKILKSGKETYSLNGLNEFSGANFLLLSENDTAAQILSLNPFLEKVTVVKNYPDTLEIKVIYQTPSAYLKVNGGYLLLSGSATVLAKSHDKPSIELPEIKYYQSFPFQNYQSGQKVLFRDIVDSLFFLEKLQELRFKINSIDIAGFYMLGLYTNEKKFYFSSEKNRKDQVYLLESSVRELKIKGQEFSTLDLRYDNPVVTF